MVSDTDDVQQSMGETTGNAGEIKVKKVSTWINGISLDKQINRWIDRNQCTSYTRSHHETLSLFLIKTENVTFSK